MKKLLVSSIFAIAALGFATSAFASQDSWTYVEGGYQGSHIAGSFGNGYFAKGSLAVTPHLFGQIGYSSEWSRNNLKSHIGVVDLSVGAHTPVFTQDLDGYVIGSAYKIVNTSNYPSLSNLKKWAYGVETGVRWTPSNKWEFDGGVGTTNLYSQLKQRSSYDAYATVGAAYNITNNLQLNASVDGAQHFGVVNAGLRYNF